MRQGHATFEEKKRAVKNYLDGESAPTIAKNIGRHRVTIYKWVELYEKNKSFDDLREKNVQVALPRSRLRQLKK